MTMEQLKRRGVSLANRYYLCGEAEESLEHLLIHCPLLWVLWTSILVALGVVWVIPFSVRDLLLGWKEIRVRRDEKMVWLAAPLVFFGQSGRKEIK